MKAPKKIKPPIPLEGAVVNAIVNRLKFYGVVVQVNPNEAMSKTNGRSTKISHARKGWPDLACYGPDGRHALLEVKRPRYTPSDVKPDQRAVHEMLRERGVHVAIVTSQDEAVEALRGWGWALGATTEIPMRQVAHAASARAAVQQPNTDRRIDR